MKKQLLLALILMLVFSGSVVASPSTEVIESDFSNLTNEYIPLSKDQQQRVINTDGYTCWQCTSYTYVNGYLVCTSGVWRTTCPIKG